MADGIMPSAFGTMEYQCGRLEDLFAEDPLSLLENSDENFGTSAGTPDVLAFMNQAWGCCGVVVVFSARTTRLLTCHSSALWPIAWEFILKVSGKETVN